MIKSTVEREIRKHGRCIVHTSGVSMEPLLYDGMAVTLEKTEKPPVRGDVVLYPPPQDRKQYYPKGAYLLHRIIGEENDCFLIRGDNCVLTERVPRSSVLAVMTGYFDSRGDYVECCENPGYLRYIRRLKYRYFYRRCRAVLGRLKRRIRNIR